MRTVFLSLCLTLCLGFSYAQDYRFGKVSDAELLQKKHSMDASADAAILYREIKTEFKFSETRGWYLTTDYFDRIKIFTKEGANYANKTVNLKKGEEGIDELRRLKAYTYTMKNGKVDRVRLSTVGVIEEEVNKSLMQTKITMPDVREGSVIEIQYAIESPFISNVDEYKFQEHIPVDKLYMSFSASERLKYERYQRGQIPIQVNVETKDKAYNLLVREEKAAGGARHAVRKFEKLTLKENTYIINMDNIPAMEEVPYVGNIENYMSGIHFELSSIDTGSDIGNHSYTWDDITRSIYVSDQFGAELQHTNYFQQDLNQLLEGVLDPLEKTNRIYSYVLQKMKWNGISGIYTIDGVKKAYKENAGNVAEINFKLTSMLRKAGLDAYPVLLSTKSQRIPLFPALKGFNYVIAAVELPQGVFLMDATNKNAEMGVLDSKVLNGNGRLITNNFESTWIPLTSSKPAVSQTLMNVGLSSNLKVTGNTQQRFSGNEALNYRNIFRNLSESERKNEIEKRNTGLNFSNISFENLDKPSESVTLNFDFETIDEIENVDGKMFISPLLFLQKENPFKSHTRTLPVDFGYPYRSQIIINFKLPDGYKVESLPENANETLAAKMGSYRYLISENGNVLRISVDMSINHPVIAESEYAKLKRFFETLVNKESEKIVLKKI